MLVPAIPDDEADRLHALVNCGLLDTPPEERFDRLTRIARHSFDVPIALVSLVDRDRQWFKSRQGVSVSETGREISFCGHAILHDSVFVIPNALEDSRFADNPLVLGPPNIRFYAGAQLRAENGQHLGTLCLIDDEPRILSEQQTHALRDLADCVEDEINKIAGRTERIRFERAKALESAILEAQTLYIASGSHESAFENLLTSIMRLTNSSEGFIGEVCHETSGQVFLKMHACQGEICHEFKSTLRDDLVDGKRLHELDLLRLEPLAQGNAVILNGASRQLHPGLSSFLGIPVRYGDELTGIVAFANSSKGYDAAVVDYLRPLSISVMQLINAIRLKAQHEADRNRLICVLEGTNAGTWEWNVQTGKTVFNRRWAELIGYTLEELEPTNIQTWMHFAHPDDLSLSNHLLEQHFSGGADFYEAQCRMRHKDGHWVWVQDRGRVFTWTKDCLPLMMFGTHIDISEQKKAEYALRESEHLYRSLANGISALIWKAGQDKSCNYVNATWLRFTGRAFEQEAGDGWMQGLHPEDVSRWLDTYHAAFDVRQPFSLEYRLRHCDGTYHWLSSNAAPTYDSAGSFLGYIGTCTDITEQRSAQSALISARDQAERANKAKSEFLSNMSHELRTPMNAILGFGQLLELDDTITPQQRDNVEAILKAGGHLLELINEILDLAKIESGHLDLFLEPLSIAPEIEECINLVQNLARQRSIRIRQTFSGNAVAYVDRLRLKQSVLNLLSNAIKYNRPAGYVDVQLWQEGSDRLNLLVTDTGPGIPAEQIENLFQPFSRLGAERSGIEGTGIGLSITRRLIEMMGGQVSVTSEVGVGSSFCIQLPMKAKASLSQDVAYENPYPFTGMSQGEKGDYSILCIEDHPANMELVNRALALRGGIRLHAANDPQAGIAMAVAHPPDLVLLDINLPGMDGFQVLEIFKHEPLLKHIPVIALTAKAKPADLERGLAAGFVDYLTKPLDIGRLLNVVEHWLAITQGGPQ